MYGRNATVLGRRPGAVLRVPGERRVACLNVVEQHPHHPNAGALQISLRVDAFWFDLRD